MMSNDKVKDIVCERLQEKLKTTLNVSDVKDVIGEADKDLFIKFRDAEITLDQLKTRIAERKFDLTFKCLDDLKQKGIIDAKYYSNVEQFLPFFNMIYSDPQR